MLKAHNISFLRLLTVGYISSETYHAVKEYGTIGNLSVDKLESFSDKCQNELKKLFLDKETVLTLGLLEEADKDLADNKGNVMQVLDNVVACLDAQDIISKIGKRRFVSDYAFCSSVMLKDSYGVSGYGKVQRLVKRFRIAYQARLATPTVTEGNDTENKEIDSNELEGGSGFTGKDLIIIEDDALSEESRGQGYEKYVKYLYSLSKEQFVSYENFLLSCGLGKRAINSIKRIGIRNFFVNYLFAESTKLFRVRNFGRKSWFEFENKKQDLIDYVIESCQDSQMVKDLDEKTECVKSLKSLTLKEIAGKDKYQLILVRYSELLKSSTLSVRARNGMNSYAGDFIEDFVHSHKNLKDLRNIGKKSVEEISRVVEELRFYIEKIIEHDFSDEEKDQLLLKSKYGSFMDGYACKVYSDKKQLPMFHIVENILESERKYDTKIQFLNYLLPMVKGEASLTLEQIAENKSLTRERVRQICTKGIDYLYGKMDTNKSDKVDYSKIVSFSEDWSYVKDKLECEDVIKPNFVEELLEQEDCNLTVSIGSLVILRIFNGEYSVVGNKPYDMPTRSKSLWNNSFLVKHELVEAFDFDDMRCTLERYFKEHDAEEMICQTAEDLVLDFFMSSWNRNMFDSSKVEAVANVVSEVLMQEYGLIPDEEFRFLIQGQKTLTAADVLFRVLTEKYEPMTVDELYDILQTKYSFKYKSPASIRGIVNSDDRLCMVGVDNLVALTEWEHIKLGSVREVIVQYLEQFDEPKPVHDIVDYVLRYRDTTENSIRSTMYSGSQFRQFDNGYFGLADKSYPDEHLYAQSLEFKERVKEMECFLIQKKHFPFASSEDNSEINLRQWWLRNKSSDSLNDVQQNEIKRIQDTYWYLPTDKREVRWFSSFNQYREFVQEHDRRPSCDNEREKSLSEWFAKAQNQFVDGELSENEEKVYLYLCKIL